MPHAPLNELPAGGGGRWPMAGESFRSVQWGDMEVGLTATDPVDCTEISQLGGMAGGVCPCPHWGYIFEGRIRFTYPGTDQPDEVAIAGEAYFVPAGHVLVYEEPTRAFELNPAYGLKQCMDAIQRGADRMASAAKDASKAPS